MRIALVLLCLAGGPAAAADLSTNAQVWGEVDVSATPAPDWRVTLLTVVREGESLPNPTLWGGGVTIDRTFGALTLSAGDLAVAARNPINGKTLDVDLPLAALSYNWRIAGFAMSDRNRFEDLVGVPGNPWRYRNRLAVEHALSRVRPLASIFASEEVFYDFQAGMWSRSRAEIGLGIAAARGADLKIYYLRQDNRSSLPRAVNALGVTWAFDLR